MKNLDVFNNKIILEDSLKMTFEEYRVYDPGSYLYGMVIRYAGDKISSDFILLVYVTLCAWNMNSRGAKLSEYGDFEKSIFEHSDILRKLAKSEIGEINEVSETPKLLRELFFNLNLVAKDKPILVTASKTLQFFLPNLVVPIDRKYTLTYFTGHTNIDKRMEKQFDLFIKIQKEFSRFASLHNLEKYKDEKWNLTVPKIMDNMIIGYIKMMGK